jgi:hypothetical protein
LDQSLIRALLQEAEEQLASAERRVSRQQDLLTDLRARGKETTNVAQLLRGLETVRARHSANRDRLLAELQRPELQRPLSSSQLSQ